MMIFLYLACMHAVHGTHTRSSHIPAYSHSWRVGNTEHLLSIFFTALAAKKPLSVALAIIIVREIGQFAAFLASVLDLVVSDYHLDLFGLRVVKILAEHVQAQPGTV